MGKKLRSANKPGRDPVKKLTRKKSPLVSVYERPKTKTNPAGIPHVLYEQEKPTKMTRGGKRAKKNDPYKEKHNKHKGYHPYKKKK